MAALDTNVLVRFLVEDDARQSAAAIQLIQRAVRAGEALYVPITVMLELEWVLRSNFGFNREQITHTLASLLASPELSIESELAAEIALALYKKGAPDYSDCMHIALAHVAGETPLWTFDRTASKIDGGKLMAV